MAIYTVGATTRFIPTTDKRGARIRVTVAGRSKVMPYDHGARDSHVQAVADSWDHWDIEGAVVSCDYVTESESGRGSVYLITYERNYASGE